MVVFLDFFFFSMVVFLDCFFFSMFFVFLIDVFSREEKEGLLAVFFNWLLFFSGFFLRVFVLLRGLFFLHVFVFAVFSCFAVFFFRRGEGERMFFFFSVAVCFVFVMVLSFVVPGRVCCFCCQNHGRIVRIFKFIALQSFTRSRSVCANIHLHCG